MDDLTERIMDYSHTSKYHKPMLNLDDIRSFYKRELWDILEELGAKENHVEWKTSQEQMDIAGEGMIKEWEVYLRAKEIPEEELDVQLPAVVEDVYGSMPEYGAYGQSLIDLSKSLKALLKKTKFSGKEKLLVKPVLSLVVMTFKGSGKEIIKLSKA